MQWSKLKKLVESRFSPTLTGRAELRITNYRKSNDFEGRAWITLDGEEVWNFCTWKYLVEHQKLTDQLGNLCGATEPQEPTRSGSYYWSGDAADGILHKQGILSQKYFEDALEAYLNMSVEDACASDNLVHRALSALDRRLGKRRLSTLALRTDEHPLVKRLLQFRLEAEGLSAATPAT